MKTAGEAAAVILTVCKKERGVKKYLVLSCVSGNIALKCDLKKAGALGPS